MEKLNVFYTERMAADSESFSPSALKPMRLAARLNQCRSIEIKEFPAIAPRDLYLSHTKEYVDGVLGLRLDNGFGNRSAAIAGTLLYTTAAQFQAAKQASTTRSLAWAFTSGFHHAHPNRGGGFCTFDGLSVAGRMLQRDVDAGLRILIIDGDAHWGDGTVACIGDDDSFQYISYNTAIQAEEARIDLQARITRFRPDLIFYQDGVDSYKHDPLSIGGLTYTELFERTRCICEIAKVRNIPIVLNLAGGYLRAEPDEADDELEPVIVAHVNSLIASMKAFGINTDGLQFTEHGPWEERNERKGNFDEIPTY